MSTIKAVLNEVTNLLAKKNITSVQVYQVEHECKKHLTNVNNKLELCIQMFNNVVTDIFESVKKGFPDDVTIDTYQKVVKKIIEDTPVEPISLFILHIYKDVMYRKSIIEGNESFFIDGDHASLTSGDKKKIATMFQFKSSWNQFDQMQKDYIKNATKMLLKIAETYIIEKDDGNKIAEAMSKLTKISTV